MRRGGLALLLGLALAGPAGAADLVDGSYGDEEGCHYAETGETSGADFFFLLNKEGVTTAASYCAFTTDQKRTGAGDFRKIPNGTGGLEDRMPMLWTHGVNTGRLTMNEFVAVTSTNIAKILNVYPRKGAILVGADADIVVWDPKRSRTISAKSQQSSIDYNVFEGKEVTGLPRYTLTRGVVAIEEGTVKTREGHGRFVKREPFAAVNRALSTWKEITAPRKVERSGIPASGV